jgi:3-oxoacyl-[acyl-carrier-protein] synthase II
MREEVAVTGIGIVTALGVGSAATLAALEREVPAFRDLTAFDASRYDVRRGGEAVAPEAAFPGVDLGPRQLDRAQRHLIGTLDQALKDARLDEGAASAGRPANPYAPHRRELLLGSTLVAMLQAADFVREEARVGPERAPYRKLAEWSAEAALRHASLRFGVRGMSLIVSNACASGAASVALAIDRLRCGRADLVVTGGFDPVCEYTHAGFGSLLLLSKSGCRPFEKGREGMLLGEGYAILVLERLADARRRGARVHALARGGAATSDGFHLTQPEPEGRGAARCIAAALADAGLAPRDVDYVNLHGTGTVFNDLAEYRALKSVFGDALPRVPVSSTKSYLGHALGGAGAVEAVISILALNAGYAPPTLDVRDVDPEMAGLDLVRDRNAGGGGRTIDARVVLSNSFGFGGANAALVFSKP